jgi:hypothetical protein
MDFNKKGRPKNGYTDNYPNCFRRAFCGRADRTDPAPPHTGQVIEPSQTPWSWLKIASKTVDFKRREEGIHNGYTDNYPDRFRRAFCGCADRTDSAPPHPG